MIHMQNIHFSYHKPGSWFKRVASASTQVLRGVDLMLESGQLFGLIGPNGAGKTTLAKLLVGIYQPTSGQVLKADGARVCLKDGTWREGLGMVSGAGSKLFNTLNLAEHIALYRRLYKRFDTPWMQHQLVAFGLDSKMASFGATLSFGERMKFEVSLTLATRPSILVLDEPTVGLDPLAIVAIRNLIRSYVDSSGSLGLLTSHNLADIATVCRQGSFLHAGLLTEPFLTVETSALALEQRYREVFRHVDPV